MKNISKHIIKILALTITCCLLATTIAPISVFAEDVSGHWAADEIIFLREKGIVQGDDNGNINPDKNITRAEFVAIINRAFGFAEMDGSNFPDVIYGAWYYDDFAIAKNEGFILGDDNGNANPNKPITRAEVAVIFARVLGLESESSLNTFADGASFPDWSTNSIIAMAENELITGYPDNTFRAANNITRAEAFAILARILIANGEDEFDDEETPLAPADDSNIIGSSGSPGNSGTPGGNGGTTTVNVVSTEPLTGSADHNSTYTMPVTVTANLDDRGTKDFAVTWSPSTADTSVCGTFEFEGELTMTSGYANPNDVKARLTLTVNPVITGITITQMPAKSQYNLGEELTIDGLIVTAIYSDDSTAVLPISIDSITGYDADTPGNQTLTVEMFGFTATFTVDVFALVEKGDLVAVVPPDPITLLNGVAKTTAGLQLPSYVEIIVDAEAGEQMAVAIVDWDVAASPYDPEIKSAQSFDLYGTVSLPEGVDNPKSISLNVHVSITVSAAAPIEFEDLNFKEAVVDNLKLLPEYKDYTKDSYLYPEDLAKVIQLIVDRRAIKNMGELPYFTNLQYLYCSNNELRSLNVADNTALQILNCEYNSLSTLDVSKNIALQTLKCGNNGLTALNVADNTALQILYCENNSLTTLDLTNNTALTELGCWNNTLTALDLSCNEALLSLECNYTNLTTLDVTSNTALDYLDCGGSKLDSVYFMRGDSLCSIEIIGDGHISNLKIRFYMNQIQVGAMGEDSPNWELSETTIVTSASSINLSLTDNGMDYFGVNGTSLVANFTAIPDSPLVSLAMVIGYDYYAEIKDGKIVITYIATIIDVGGKVRDVPTTFAMYNSNSRIGIVSSVTTDNSGRYTFFAPNPTDPTYKVDTGITKIEKGSTILQGSTSVVFASNTTKFVFVNFKNDPDDEYYRYPDGTVTVYTGKNNVPTFDPLCNTIAVSYSIDGAAGSIADIVFIFDDVFAASESTFVYIVGSWSWIPDGYAVDVIMDGKWDTITVRSAYDRNVLVAMAGKLWNNIRVSSIGVLDISGATELFHDISVPQPRPSAGVSIKSNGGLLELDGIYIGYTADDDVPVYTITRTDADGAYLVEERTAKYLNDDSFSFAYLDVDSDLVVSAIYIIKNSDYIARTITSFAAVNVYTIVESPPSIIPQITAYYSDGARGNVFVAWDSIDYSQYALAGKFTVQGTVAGTSIRPSATVTVLPSTPSEGLAMVIGYDSYSELKDGKIITTYIATIIDIDGNVSDVPTIKAMYDASARVGVVSLFSIDSSGRHRFADPLAVDPTYRIDNGIHGIDTGSTVLQGGVSVYLANNVTKFVIVNYKQDPDDESRRIPDGTVTVYTGSNNVPTFDTLTYTTAVSYNADGVASNIANIVFIYDDVYATTETSFVYVTGIWSQTEAGYAVDVVAQGKWDTITVRSVVDREILMAMEGKLWNQIKVNSTGTLDIMSAEQLLYSPSTPQSAQATIEYTGGILLLDGFYTGYNTADNTPVYTISKSDTDNAYLVEEGTAKYLNDNDFSFAYLDVNSGNVVSAIYIIKNNAYVERTITSYAAVNVYTLVESPPSIIPQITAYYSDGARGNVFVTWDSIDSSQYASAGMFTVQGTVAGASIRPSATVTVLPSIPSTGLAMVIGYDSYSELKDGKIITTYIATIIDIDGNVSDVLTIRAMYEASARVGAVSLFTIDNTGRHLFADPGTFDPTYKIDNGIHSIDTGSTDLQGGTSVNLASNVTKFVIVNYKQDPDDDNMRIPDGIVTVCIGSNNVPTFSALTHTSAVSYSADGYADNVASIVFIFDDVYAAYVDSYSELRDNKIVTEYNQTIIDKDDSVSDVPAD